MKPEKGQAAVEIALIIAAIAVPLVIALYLLGSSVNDATSAATADILGKIPEWP